MLLELDADTIVGLDTLIAPGEKADFFLALAVLALDIILNGF